MSFTQPREYPSEILAKDSKDNAEATATVTAGVGNQRIYITGVDAFFSVSTTSALLQLKDGSTTIWEGYVHGRAEINFPSPLKGSMATAFSAVLEASGTGGTIGKVNLRGYMI